MLLQLTQFVVYIYHGTVMSPELTLKFVPLVLHIVIKVTEISICFSKKLNTVKKLEDCLTIVDVVIKIFIDSYNHLD